MKFLAILLVLFGLLFAKTPLKSVPTFDITDIQGNSYHIVSTEKGLDIKELKGKVVFLAFFGHRCPPCRMEMPGFVKFTNDKDYAKKAVILGFEVQGIDEEGLKSFAKDRGLNYRLVAGSKYSQFIDLIGYRTKWNWGIPFMVVLDTNGKVVNFGNGIVSPEELKNLTDTLYTDTNSTTITTTVEDNSTKEQK